MTLHDQLRGRRIPALDGLRAVFVLLVVVMHAGVSGVPGDLGVTGFFALSGFLITRLLLAERSSTGSVSLTGFYLRRSLRIFPAYFAFVAFSFVADLLLGSAWTGGETVSALTYTVNYDNAFTGHDHPIAHAWSLAIEEQFYLLWPLIFLFFRRGRAMLVATAGLVVLVAAWRSWLFIGADVGTDYVYNALDTRFDALAIGCMLALLCASPRFLARAQLVAGNALYPVGIAAALYLSRTSSEGWHYTLGMTVEAILFGVLILQMVTLSQHRAWKWLDARPLAWLGTLSYSLYLWHLWGLGAADEILRGAGGAGVEMALGICLAVGLAAGSFYFIERPFLALRGRLERRTTRPRGRQAEPAQAAVQLA